MEVALSEHKLSKPVRRIINVSSVRSGSLECHIIIVIVNEPTAERAGYK